MTITTTAPGCPVTTLEDAWREALPTVRSLAARRPDPADAESRAQLAVVEGWPDYDPARGTAVAFAVELAKRGMRDADVVDGLTRETRTRYRDVMEAAGWDPARAAELVAAGGVGLSPATFTAAHAAATETWLEPADRDTVADVAPLPAGEDHTTELSALCDSALSALSLARCFPELVPGMAESWADTHDYWVRRRDEEDSRAARLRAQNACYAVRGAQRLAPRPPAPHRSAWERRDAWRRLAVRSLHHARRDAARGDVHAEDSCTQDRQDALTAHVTTSCTQSSRRQLTAA